VLASVGGLAALYVALLDEMDLTDVTLVGNSIGGWIAAEMALLQFPGSARQSWPTPPARRRSFIAAGCPVLTTTLGSVRQCLLAKLIASVLTRPGSSAQGDWLSERSRRAVMNDEGGFLRWVMSGR
jgi:pimeloyl-ACP methyl ester carboxylesterase